MKIKKQKGFSLLELLVAIFIFSVAVLVASIIFAKSMQTYRNSNNIQNNLENAQFALNLMAKVIRQGQAVEVLSGNKEIKLYDGEKCRGYKFDGDNKLKTGSSSGLCDSSTITYNETLVENVDKKVSKFILKETDLVNSPKQVGLVTIFIKLCSDTACLKSDKMTLQTSVSLRNYGFNE